MTIERRVSLKDLPRQLAKDIRALEDGLKKGVQKTARDAVKVIRAHVPKAFGELSDDIAAEIQGDLPRTVSKAPHAAPVETGSRPHWMPLEPLIAWVKLRGMQGLTKKGRINTGLLSKNPAKIGTTTAWHAITTAAKLKRMEKGGALDIDAPIQIAKAIQAAIAQHGTKPHWYVRQSLPEIQHILGENLTAALQNALH